MLLLTPAAQEGFLSLDRPASTELNFSSPNAPRALQRRICVPRPWETGANSELENNAARGGESGARIAPEDASAGQASNHGVRALSMNDERSVDLRKQALFPPESTPTRHPSAGRPARAAIVQAGLEGNNGALGRRRRMPSRT